MTGYQPLSRAAADQHAVDCDALKKLRGQVIADAGGAVILPLALLGDRLGLFSALASGIPATAGQLAERTGLTKRLHRKKAVMARRTGGRRARTGMTTSAVGPPSPGRPCSPPARPVDSPGASWL
jgi:hypothetical protein